MEKNSKIYIAGHLGLVGSSIKLKLEEEGYRNLIYRSREELDLLDSNKVAKFFVTEKPEYVFVAAAKVGGILANDQFPAEFIYENLTIQNNIIHNSYLTGIKKLLFLGSTCIYPKMAQQPLKEEYLLTDKLEPTNEPYAIAKIAGIKMCQSYNRQYGTNFIAAMPTNLYGPNDNFDLNTSHVMPALIRKIHQAKTNNLSAVKIWGTGKPKREFLYISDLAAALVHMITTYNPSKDDNERGEMFLNVGVGEDISILDLTKLVSNVVGYTGRIEHDLSKPDGTPRKLVDASRLFETGWSPNVSLEEGIKKTYKWYLENYEE